MAFIKKTVKLIFAATAALLAAVLIVNFIVIIYGNRYIVEPDKTKPGYDCIIVLGCAVYGSTPSDMLRDRLDRAVELYLNGTADTILMSGDGSGKYYNEVRVMKEYAVSMGVPEDAVLTDILGLSTYETMYRARKIYGIERPLIVTQRFHLYRSLFNARGFGMVADGTVSVPNTYVSQMRLSAREVLARNKDFVYLIFKPEPIYPDVQ